MAPARTFQDLLKNPHDEALLEYYLSAQLAQVVVAGNEAGRVMRLGSPRMVARCDPSPDGHYLYLIEHTTAKDLTQYRVRAYDLKQRRLLPKIVADRRSWDTTMSGTAITRLSSDGWAYTLYGGSSSLPFIHALDTRHVSAVCINMPWKYQPDKIWSYRLRTDGDGHLVVRGPHGRALVTVDRQSFRVLSSVRNP